MLRTRKPEAAPSKLAVDEPRVSESEVPAPRQSRATTVGERVDLPALERVNEKAWGAIGAYLLLGTVPVALLAGILISLEWLRSLLRAGETGPHLFVAAGIGGAGLLSLLGWLLARLGRGDFAWSTDPEGIEARGLFRRRRLRWTEITAATFHELSGRYHLAAGSERISFVSGSLAASVWQHLRRHDRHHAFHLEDAPASIWDEYPTTPLPFRWTNPARLPAGLADSLGNEVGCWVLVIAMVVAGFNLNGWGTLESVLTLIGIAGAAMGLHRCRRNSRRCVRHCEVTSAGLRGETWLGPFELRWEEITHAGWQLLGSKTVVLRVGGVDLKPPILIPVERGDPEIAPLFFTLLRRLRHAEHPQSVTVPHWLRAPTGKDPNGAAPEP